jgi:translation initiation factor IF-2
MAEDKMMRLSQVAKQINVGLSSIVDHLAMKGFKVDLSPNTKINFEQLTVLAKDYSAPDLLKSAPAIAVVPSTNDDDNSTKQKSVEEETGIKYFREEKPKEVTTEKPTEKEILVEKPIEIVKPVLPPTPVVEVKTIVVEVPKVEVVETKPVPKIDLPKVELPKPEPKFEQPKIVAPEPELIRAEAPKVGGLKVVGKIDLNPKPKHEERPAFKPVPKPVEVKKEAIPPPKVVEEIKKEAPKQVVEVVVEPEIELIEAKGDTLKGLTVLGKIVLPVEPVRSRDNNDKKKKRKRIDKPNPAKPNDRGPQKPGEAGAVKKPYDGANRPAGAPGTTAPGTTTNTNTALNKKGGKGGNRKEDISEKDVQDKIKATMARMGGSTNKPVFGARERRDKRKMRAERTEQRQLAEDEEAKILKVTEFISASDLASMMDVSVNEVISACMSLGMFVSINQRLDAEAISIIAEEFEFEVQFVSAEEEVEATFNDVEDKPEDLVFRAPIVTIMGHVDHGKTSLLDYIRNSKVAAGEAGGITQHIGAYSVKTEGGKMITFLDTPGHEAFTAMRARGAKVTDVVIIVIAADDSVMATTKEAINHALVAGVPIVFAYSKIDKPGANADKVREQLSAMNLLVEEWGGKYQSQEISSKTGAGINDLLEKVLLEAELLELTANPNKKANGVVIEAQLDKGRGYLTTVLVQAGTLKVGEMMLAGAHYGRVKAMFDHRGKKLKEVGPSEPALVLGLNGAPQAGDKLNALENEREAREVANKREQILREQSMRVRKHITLEEIGRRKAIGTFKELNVIVKGDVDGSVEALSDSLLKLSTEEIQVRILHKGVGQVSESDVLLASSSDAIIVAFQVRPSANARKLAENEQIEIRTYSIIYQAIDEIRDAMEGLLAPSVEEHITANIEVREVFKISKIGTVAGSYVLDGTVKRSHKIRVLRDFVVVHEGEISALKRFKDDVQEVKFGYECGISIKNFNDLEVGDVIECYELKEVKRKL